MNWGWILLNTAYFIYVLSPLVRSMLVMRTLLLAATFLYIAYGLYEPVWSIFWWNVPFGLVTAWQIWRLVRQRLGVSLSEEDEAIRILLFPDLDRPLFNTFWHSGEERTATDEVLITAGEPVNELLLILAGEAEVDVPDAGGRLVRLSRLSLIGEMSSVSGGTASATVSTVGSARLRVWDKQKLAELGKKHPEIDRSALMVIAQDLARKAK